MLIYVSVNFRVMLEILYCTRHMCLWERKWETQMSKLNIVTHQLKFDICLSINQIWPFYGYCFMILLFHNIVINFVSVNTVGHYHFKLVNHILFCEYTLF